MQSSWKRIVLTTIGYSVAMMLFVVLRWTHIEAMLVSPVAQIPIIDSKYYLEWGIRVADGLGLGPHPFFMSPLYPLFIAFAGTLGEGFTASTLHLQLLMSAMTMLLIGKFTARRVDHPLAGPTAALMFAFYAPAIYYDGVLLSASLILFLTMVALTLLDAPARGGVGLRWWRVAGAGVAIGLSALARPNALILLPAFGLLFLWWGWRDHLLNKRHGLKSVVSREDDTSDLPRTSVRGRDAFGLRKALFTVVILTFATVIVILPAMFRNAQLGGEFSLTTSSAGMNLYVGNHPLSNGLYTQVAWLASAEPSEEAEAYRQEAMRRTGKELTDLAASRYWFGEALEWMAGHPLDWIGLEFKKLAWFFHNEEAPNNVSFYGAEKYSQVLQNLNLFRFGLLAALALPGLFLLGGGRRMHLPRVLVIAYLFANMLFFVAGEYRYPIVGVLIPAAVISIFRVVGWFRAHDAIPALRTIIVTIILILMTHIPYSIMRTISSPETDFYNWGLVAHTSGDLTNASLLFTAALAERPGWQDAHLQLAYVFREMGMRDMADKEFAAAGVTQEDLARLKQEEELAEQWFGIADLDTMKAEDLAELAAQFNLLQRHNAALSAAVVALKKDSTNVQAAFERAFAQESRGRLKEAITLYQRLEYLHRNDPMLPYRIAWCYYGLGEGRNSQKALARAKSKAQELYPGPYRDQWIAKLDEAVIQLGNY